MKQPVSVLMIMALLGSTILTTQCAAAEELLAQEMARYRSTVLAGKADPQPEAPPVVAAAPGPLWAQISSLVPMADDEAAEQPASYIPWPQRRGPAYPDDKWRSFGRDAKELPFTVWDDTKACATSPVVILGFLAAGGAGIAINATGVDDTIDERTDGHRHLNSEADGIGGFFGSPAFHFPLAAVMYAGGLIGEDAKLYEVSKTLMNALIINGLTNVALKVMCRTRSPNGDALGWPSGHTSSSFVVATVINETYGPLLGIPLFAFAGYVGYERIDARNHDFSDVISGMIMGIVIGYAVAHHREPKVFGFDVLPMAGPDGTIGVMLAKTW